MKIQKLTVSLIAGVILSACTIANAASENKQEHRIYVYEGCKKINEYNMNDKQIAAYKALKQHELAMSDLEKPLKNMEQELSLYEREMESLSGELVSETDGTLLVNKSLIAKHEAIARKMQQVVKVHESDIQKLESRAKKIEKAAHLFEKEIHQSIPRSTNKNIHISVGEHNKPWRCEV